MGQADFQARIERLGMQGEAEAAAALAAPRRRNPKDIDDGSDWRVNIRYPLSFVGAFALGMLSVVLSRMASSNMVGTPDPNGDLEMLFIGEGVLAFLIAFFLRMAFSMSSKELMAAKAIGVFVMLCTMHNLVHMAPGLWAIINTPDWVEFVLMTTEPNSILFRGITFTLE